MSFGFSVGDFVTISLLAASIRKKCAFAPIQLRDLSADVQHLNHTLQDINLTYPWSEDNARAQDLRDIVEGSLNVIRRTDGILQQFAALSSTSPSGTLNWMGRARKKIRKAWGRVQWDPEEVGYLQGRTLHYTSLAVTIRNNCDNTRVTILNWLSPTDHHITQQEYHSKRFLAGTGEWLLQSQEFQAWSVGKAQVLLCHGIPGAGKSTLTSRIISFLAQQYEGDNSVAIAFLYCDYKRDALQGHVDLIAAILKQLARLRPTIPENIHRLHDRHNTYQTRPSAHELSKELGTVIELFSNIYLIVDGLDECTDITRTRFLGTLAAANAKDGVNLLVTAQSPDILSNFDEYKLLEIRAQDEDLVKYTKECMELLPPFVRRRPSLQDRIIAELVRAVDGMFVLLDLYVGLLARARTPHAMENALQALARGPKGYNAAYEKVMARIENQHTSQLARSILALVAFAKRPLTILEVQHALAVADATLEPPTAAVVDAEDIATACSGFLATDEDGGTLRLVHRTVQEFLEQHHWFTRAHEYLGKTCLTYVLLDGFSEGRCDTDKSYEARLLKYPFYEYASGHWGYHVLDAAMEDHALLLEFLNSEDKISACSQALLAQKCHKWPGYSHRATRGVTAMHLAAYFGLQKIAARQGAHNSAVDSNGRTPMSWAAEQGHAEFMSQLLKSNQAEADNADRLGRNPLLWATMNGHDNAVAILINAGQAKLSRSDMSGRTALSWAAGNGHKPIVQSLIGAGMDPNDRDTFGRTALSWAAEFGSDAIMRLLLVPGVELDAQDNSGRTPLSRASESGHVAAIKFLLDSGDIDVNSQDLDGRTPLSWAADVGSEPVVRHLLSLEYVSVNSRSRNGRTAFSWATGSGRAGVVKIFLEQKGIDVDSPDCVGHTPLIWAAERGHDIIVDLLIKTDRVRLDQVDLRGRSALFWAARNGHHRVVESLLKRLELDRNSKDTNGRTPVSWAAGNGHVAVLGSLLMSKGCDINSKDSLGRTPLSWACENGKHGVVRVLIQSQAIVDSRDREGRTPLSWAVESGQLAVVKELVSMSNASPFSRDKKGRTPLETAITEGHADIAVYLSRMDERQLIQDRLLK